MEYKVRIADQLLERKLRGKGAVLIRGAKWCGKTTTAEQVARSVIYMDDPKLKSTYLRLAEIGIEQLLEGETPHLLSYGMRLGTRWIIERLSDNLSSPGVLSLLIRARSITAGQGALPD